jgi:hypothetical protein
VQGSDGAAHPGKHALDLMINTLPQHHLRPGRMGR